MIDYTNFKNKEEIIQFIKENSNGYSRTIKAHNKPLYEEVMGIGKGTFAENMYIYLYGEKGCERCGTKTTFVNILNGYRPHCKECYEFMRSRKELWGPPPKCINPLCGEAAYGENAHTGRWNLHCSLKCRGVHNSNVSREKAKISWMEKYGVDHPRKLPESLQKLKDTINKKYGVDNIVHIEGVKDKIKNTNMERYGAECSLMGPDIIKRIKQTNLEKFGVENPSQNLEIHRKKLRSAKKYILCDGNEVDVQGYEPFFLDSIKQLIPTNIGMLGVPKISYIHNDENKVYFPDFFIDSYNCVIEIKSPYTIECDKEMIYNKILGTLCAGYDYVLYVYDDKTNVMSCMYFNENIYNLMHERVVFDDYIVKTGGTYSQYVKDGVSINFRHGFFSNEIMVKGENYWKLFLEKVNQTYVCYLFDHTTVGYNSYILSNFVENIFDSTSKSIYARDCEVRQAVFKDANEFLYSYHLQGGGVTSSINYGLFHNEELVSLMCFSRPRLGIGKKRDNTYELVRFCSKGRVVGGASRLLKNFIKDNPCDQIVSYSDNSYSNGDLYKTLGFTLESDIRPRYKYIKIGSDELEPRFKYTKFKLKGMQYYHETLSEKDIMTLEGYVRVYDCGKKTWVYQSGADG